MNPGEVLVRHTTGPNQIMNDAPYLVRTMMMNELNLYKAYNMKTTAAEAIRHGKISQTILTNTPEAYAP
ncbi:hypothetical protein OSTOST_18465 [Ostertagia ostertagi]